MKVEADRLHRFITASLGALGVPDDDASIVADSLVEAELEGQSGHGAIRFPFVLSRLKEGLIDPHPTMRIVNESAAAALLDGGTYIQSSRESNLGQSFLVIDPAAFDAGFAKRMTALADVIRAEEPLDPSEPIRVPGDRRRSESAMRREHGIHLDDGLVRDLEAAAGQKL